MSYIREVRGSIMCRSRYGYSVQAAAMNECCYSKATTTIMRVEICNHFSLPKRAKAYAAVSQSKLEVCPPAPPPKVRRRL
jgi:hypothetical protein